MRYLIIGATLSFVACAAPAPHESSDAETMPALDASFAEEELESMPDSPPEPPKPNTEAEQPTYSISANGVSGLPGSDGKTFARLDDYLAHLEVKGHTDRPFWERMKDGRYLWNTGRGMQFSEPKYATRDELLEKYGFSD